MKIFLINNDSCSNEQLSQMTTSIKAEYRETEIIELSEDLLSIDSFDSDSILLICFTKKNPSRLSIEISKKYLDKFHENAIIFPVAFSTDNFIEIDKVSGRKSISINQSNWLNNLKNRIGTSLGIKSLAKDHQVFISYRQTDGEQIAKDLSSHLKSLGFQVWRDEDRDEDNEGNLKAGEDVQKKIKEALLKSSLVLLVDTHEAPQSKYVRDEIDIAHSHLVPVLPLCVRNDGKKGSHFRGLTSLNRYIQTANPSADLEIISEEIFEMLAEVYKRKKRLPFEVAKKFQVSGYSWSIVDAVKLLFNSSKKKKFSSLHKLLSHCPIYDGIHDPFIHKFIEAAGALPEAYNEKIYVYDGAIHTEEEISYILGSNPTFERSNIVILHHEQIEEFLTQ